MNETREAYEGADHVIALEDEVTRLLVRIAELEAALEAAGGALKAMTGKPWPPTTLTAPPTVDRIAELEAERDRERERLTMARARITELETEVARLNRRNLDG